jgi:hypothetical protein
MFFSEVRKTYIQIYKTMYTPVWGNRETCGTRRPTIRQRRREISSLTQDVSDEAAVLSAQADRFAGAKREEKASACSARNDGVGSDRTERSGAAAKIRMTRASPPRPTGVAVWTLRRHGGKVERQEGSEAKPPVRWGVC